MTDMTLLDQTEDAFFKGRIKVLQHREGYRFSIDAVLLEILKAIAFMGVGSLGTVSGRKGVSAVAKMIAGEDK